MLMVEMYKATVAGNAQYMLQINSNEQVSSDTKKATPTKSNATDTENLKIVKRFEVKWKFYKGQLTDKKRLQIAA